MTYLSSILLGFIQGVAEFLPISSSGHLAIAQNLLNLDIGGTQDHFFDVLLHMGTLIAIFIVYWRDIWDMICEFFGFFRDVARRESPKQVPPARRLILLIIIGTLPLFAVLPVKDKIETLSSNMPVVGAALLVTGVLLFMSDRFNKGRKSELSATVLDVIIIGIGQAIATVPGISRSGMTISLGCFCGLDRRFAVRYSFLMSIPAVLGANILSLKDAMGAGIDTSLLPVYAVGVLTAAVFGYLSIRLLKFVADKGKFGAFAYYCWAVGALTLIASLV
ncbi:MAG: undecaprenyl-diphosphate phosphatase [Oscillospiraceae bacterium]|nr:undecaprenyl-diphosphate phosphatase [Oscillospiraceae bacterium]